MSGGFYRLCLNEKLFWAECWQFFSMQVGPTQAPYRGVQQKNEFFIALKCDVLAIDISNPLIFSSLRFATTVVLESLIVVETKDASSVVDKNKTKDVTANIKSLKKNNRDEINYHREVHRTWGTYDRLHVAGCLFLKRIVF